MPTCWCVTTSGQMMRLIRGDQPPTAGGQRPSLRRRRPLPQRLDAYNQPPDLSASRSAVALMTPSLSHGSFSGSDLVWLDQDGSAEVGGWEAVVLVQPLTSIHPSLHSPVIHPYIHPSVLLSIHPSILPSLRPSFPPIPVWFLMFGLQFWNC